MHSEAWPKVVRLLHAVVQADFQIESLELIETRCVTVRLKILLPLNERLRPHASIWFYMVLRSPPSRM